MPKYISPKNILRAKRLQQNWAETAPELATEDLTLKIFTDQLTATDNRDVEILAAEAHLKSLREARRIERRVVNTSYKRIMSVAKGHFGDDSTEYKLLGGVPLSERARSSKPSKAANGEALAGSA